MGSFLFVCFDKHDCQLPDLINSVILPTNSVALSIIEISMIVYSMLLVQFA